MKHLKAAVRSHGRAQLKGRSSPGQASDPRQCRTSVAVLHAAGADTASDPDVVVRTPQPLHLGHDGVVLESTELRSWSWPTPENLAPVVVLHGSGQDENTFLSFARAACPGHTIISVRGRIAWEEGFAFFRRNPDRTLDERDLEHGAGLWWNPR